MNPVPAVTPYMFNIHSISSVALSLAQHFVGYRVRKLLFRVLVRELLLMIPTIIAKAYLLQVYE
jgi:hypothetical protein